MASYSIKHQTGDVRCAWCWEATGTGEAHVVVESRGNPHLELRFHRRCWSTYHSVSGIEPENYAREWTPPRLELLRIHCGLNQDDFARKLGIQRERLLRAMNGDTERVLGYSAVQLVKNLAIKSGFEGGDYVDWSKPEAVFCLRMSQRWSKLEMGRRIGRPNLAVWRYEREGVPKRALKTRAALTELARKHGFDQGDVVPHRLWTRELLQQAMIESGRKQVHWIRGCGCSAATFQGWASGRRQITAEGAWMITRAAARFEVELPPVGLVKGRKRLPQPQAADFGHGRQSTWTVEQLRTLGTAPDRIIAERLGRTFTSTRQMRRFLRIPLVKWRGWDGKDRPQPVADAELLRRQREWRNGHAREVRTRALAVGA